MDGRNKGRNEGKGERDERGFSASGGHVTVYKATSTSHPWIHPTT